MTESREVSWAVSGPEFEGFVQRHRQRLAIIHFWAEWNPLDPHMFPVFDEVNEAVGSDVALARVQVGPPANIELCRWLGIVQVPTVLFLFRNQIIDIKVGYSKNRLLSHVQMLMQACYSAGPEQTPFGVNPNFVPMSEVASGVGWPQGEAPGFQQAGVDPRFYQSLDSSTGQGMQPGDIPIAPGFGVPNRHPDSTQFHGRPAMRFGIYAPQPTAPVVMSRQKKSWLSRWLGLD